MARGRLVAASLSVLVSAAIGVVTNVVTADWNVVLIAVLGTLVILGVLLQWLAGRADGGDAPATPATQVARATRGGRVIQAGRDIVMPGAAPPPLGATETDRDGGG